MKQPIIENLEYLKETKEAIREAIVNKGVSVQDTDTFRSYAEKIDSIEPNNIEDLIVANPKVSAQSINPSSGYAGIKQVIINGVTSNIDENIKPENIKQGVTILDVTGNLNSNKIQDKVTVVPSTSQQNITPSDGYDGMSEVEVLAVNSNIDENIKPENIKSGVNILGVDGSFEGKSGIPSGGNIGDILTKNGTQDNDTVWKSYNNILLYKGNIPNLESIPELTQESAKADAFNLSIPVFDITTFDLTDEEKASIGADVHQHYFAWKIGNNVFGMSTDNEDNFRGISIQQNYEVIGGTTHINKSMFTYINATSSSPVYINYYIDDNNLAGVYTQLDGDNYEQHKETGLIEFTKPAVIIFNGNLDAEYYLQNISTSLYNLYFMSSDDAEMQRLMPFTGPFLSFYVSPEPGVSRRYGYKTMTRGNFSYSDKMIMITTDVLLNRKMFLTNELNDYYHQYDMYTVGEDMLIYVILNNQFVRFSSYYTKKEIDDMFYTVEEALNRIIEGE